MKPSAWAATRIPATRIAARAVALGLSLSVAGLALAITGCASDGTTNGLTTGAPGVGVYVIQNTIVPSTGPTPSGTSGSVLEFSTTASGAATPISTIAGPSAAILGSLSIDGTGDIYTISHSTAASSILEYAVGSANDATPARSIPFNATTGLSGVSIAVDATGDIYAVSASGAVSIFDSGANGSVAPSSTFTLAPGTNAQAPAVDPSGNLYIATASTSANNSVAPIEVFAPGATGNVAPTRSIAGALTTLSTASPQGIATDTAGNLYVANVVSGVSSILIFDPTATGNTPPLRDITGSNTLLGCVGGIAVDSEGYLYVVSTPTCESTANPTVLKFSTTGDGNIAPVSTFSSAAWTNADVPLSIAVY